MSYVELHAHSAFSFLDGASLPEELAVAAADRGYGAFALTDHDGLWGSMEFAQACTGLGLRPITGAELTVRLDPYRAPDRPLDGGFAHLTVLVESAAGYRNLCRLLTLAHAHTRDSAPTRPLSQPSLTLEDLTAHSAGLVCLSGCARDGVVAGRIARDEHAGARRLAGRLHEIFGSDGFRIEIQHPYWRGDRVRNRRLSELAASLGIPTVATGNVHAHDRSRSLLQDAFVAIRLRATLDETEPQRRGNGSSALASPEAMARRFAEHPEAVTETERLAERLRFDLTRDLGYRYPGSENPGADRGLHEACRARFGERYDGAPHRVEAERRLEEELRVISKLRLSGFFLLHRDLLELARDVAVEVRGADAARALLPPGRGRGSSVSSIVCYLTGLSHVDPVKAGLFLGRFLNEEISDAPDIDLDFPRDIREKLIPRIHERYGADRSALVAAFPTYRSKGAVRDLGMALGLPAGEIERVARSADIYGNTETIERDMVEALGASRARCGRWQALLTLAKEAYRLPRHASQHSGGMVLSTRPLDDLCPIVPAAMEGRQIVQWDKDSCADAGFLKIDLLGLGMLSAVERTVTEIARARGEQVDLSRIPLDDREVYARIQAAETTGVFQIESRAQMQMLPRSRPENLDDLIVQVAIVRPGPIQGGAVHPYLERRKLLREDPDYQVPYEHPLLEPILSDTLGAIVFQDQVIQVAMSLAGFSAGEAEGLRRAMSRKRSEEAMRAYRERFIEGAVGQGVEEDLATRIYEQVQGFAGFGFPKSHAAAFGLLAYQSTWLRVYYGPEFLSALLNEQPMGFYPPDALVHEAQRRGIEVRGPDVNLSAVLCRTEPVGLGEGGVDEDPGGDGFLGRPPGTSSTPPSLAVRVGLGYVKGLKSEDAEAVVSERDRGGLYRDLADLASRSGVSRDGLERLGWASATASLEQEATRRSDLWRIGTARGAVRRRGGEQLSLPLEVPPAPALPEQTAWEQVTADYASTGISLGIHPMSLIREELSPGTSSSRDLDLLPDNSPIRIAGMVVARQRPATANGVVFMLFEDEWGMVNLVILPPAYERYRLIVRTAPFALAHGRLERREGVVNVVVDRLERLDRPGAPRADVRSIKAPAQAHGERSGEDRQAAAAELGAVLPAAHSFGRRGR